ncbi:hypothetical protein ACA910_001334 [Epithemia clementina (nom. ined.)]
MPGNSYSCARALDQWDGENELMSSMEEHSKLQTSPEASQEQKPVELDSLPSTNASTESDEERRRREEEESLELARMLMAEEAMASYRHSVQMLRESRDQLPPEDYEALQAALQEEDHVDESQLFEDEEGNLSYETMLQLGERIGDVKSDRWTIIAQSLIDKLPTESYNPEEIGSDGDDSEFKCLICQHEYSCNEELRRLPSCGHCFHMDCVDQWLLRTDLCPYCRTSIKNNLD